MLREVSTGDAQEPRGTEPPLVPAGRPWGFWATLGFGILAIILSIVAGFAAIFLSGFCLALLRDGTINLKHLPSIVHNEAVVLSSHISICASVVLLTVLFTWIRSGTDIAQYLALKPIPVKDIALWVGIALFVRAVRILLCLSRDLTLMSGTAGNFSAGSEVVQYALALPLLGSTAYTLLFQGFLFAGFQSSRIGIRTFALLAAIYLLPSIAFGGPYETILDAVDVFLLTLARWRTKSLYTALGMTILSNELEAATVILFNLPSA